MLRAISHSIRHRIVVVVLATTLVALLVAGGAMMAYELHGYQKTLEMDLATQAEILGKAAAPALEFDDPKTALGYLALLRARPSISAAAIYTAKGGVFARYVREGASVSAIPVLPRADGYARSRNELLLFRRIIEDNEILGTVYLRADYQLMGRVTDYLSILALVLGFSLLTALALSAWLQGTVTRPILDVSAVAHQVMERRDFSLRARKTSHDEVGYLVDTFNEMLAEVARRADALHVANEKLQREMDERLRAEESLRTLNAELERRVGERTTALEAANKELEGFSYSVSHDLRAPLRAVLGYARMLEEDHAERLDEEARRLLNVVQSEAQRMGALIDDLLEFSRLGRQSMQQGIVDMNQLVRSTFDRLLTQHSGSAVDFRLGALPYVKCDRALMVQVWTNLLSNALKFSAIRERPAIEVSAITDSDEHIYFVRDNGAGFDPRYASKLFGVFQRLHDANEFAGTGVGLALVHRIVSRHGGRVWADGKPGAGATFYFALPKENVDEHV